MKHKEEISSFPHPPRILMVGFAVLSIAFFLAGFFLNHRGSLANFAKLPQSTQASQQAKTKTLLITTSTLAGANAIQSELKKEGFESAIQETRIETEVKAGYVVAQDLDPSAAKPVANTLSDIYHFQVSLQKLSDIRTRVQVGPVYQTRQEAQAVVNKLARLGFTWKVMEYHAKKPQIGYQVKVMNFPASKRETLQKKLAKTRVQFSISP
jgi:hypothetical protein